MRNKLDQQKLLPTSLTRSRIALFVGIGRKESVRPINVCSFLSFPWKLVKSSHQKEHPERFRAHFSTRLRCDTISGCRRLLRQHFRYRFGGATHDATTNSDVTRSMIRRNSNPKGIQNKCLINGTINRIQIGTCGRSFTLETIEVCLSIFSYSASKASRKRRFLVYKAHCNSKSR
jgi:hypothetical protein